MYRAIEIATERKVAVKILKPNSSDDPLVALERFRVESVTSMKVRHPHSVEVFDYGISEGQIAYIVMEYLEGINLSDKLKTEGYPTPTQSLHILRCCAGLVSGARQGVVHRDVKPSNVFLTGPRKRPVSNSSILVSLAGGCPSLHPQLTQAGALIGTPVYGA